MGLPAADCPTDRRIGRWTLLASRDELVLDAHRVKLEPRLTRLLLVLCDGAGDVVATETLVRSVWGRLHVTRNSLHEAVARLRRVLAADKHTPAYIATVPRRGYRLVAHTRPVDGDRPGGPRLAVLPFRAVDLDPRLAPLRERLLEGLTVALSRRTPCTVLARGSALVMAAGADPIGEAARRFGASYVIDGSLSVHGYGLRITAELVDAAHGEQLWATRIDVPAADGPELAGPLVDRLARALELHLAEALARDGSAGLSEARRLGMQAWVELFCRPESERTNVAAWSLAGQALCHQPDEVLALVSRACAGFRAANFGWQGLPRDETLASSLLDVRHALELDPESHDGSFIQAMLVLLLGEVSGAEALLRHALRLVPDMAPALGSLAYVRLVQGHPDEVDALCARAFDVSPCDPQRASWHWHQARAAMERGDAQRSLAESERALAANPDLAGGYLCGVMAAQALGRGDLVARWLPWIAARPRYGTAERVRRNYGPPCAANARYREQLADALRLAGLPEC